MSDEMDEIWALFVDDGAQAMDAMEAALLALDGAPPSDQPPHVAALFRAIHTFKGNSRVLGLGVVEGCAHLAEDLIGLVRDQGVPLDAAMHALLLETGDRLRDMLELVAATRADADPAATEPLMARLRAMILQCSATPAEAGEPGTAPTAAVPAPEKPVLEEPVCGGPAPADPGTTDTAPDAQAPGAAAAPAGPRLADDPAYRAIFAEMVAGTLGRLRAAAAAGTPDGVARDVADLAHAAAQLGLDDWTLALRTLPQDPAATDVGAIVAMIERLSAADPEPAAALAPAQDAGFFRRIEPPLSTLARIGIDFATGTAPDAETLGAAVAGLSAAADAEGYVRVAEAARALPNTDEPAAYSRAILRLYEELSSVEAVLGDGDAADGFSPAALLASWCADHVFVTLDELDATLERMRRGTGTGTGTGDNDSDQAALARLVRLVHHACRYYGLDMASQLAMSLLDLFGRGHARGDAPDAILLRIARGFIDTLELVFDALREGETPDIARIEQLFAEASEAGFTGAGVMTAAAIERKLGLPSEFHRVLSPDSTRTAGEALARGLQFHLLRADVNADAALAEALFDFIGSGAIQAITNVTVFKGEETLFDFLIATALQEFELAAEIARLDPGGRKLVLLRKLVPADAPAQGPEAEAAEPWPDTATGTELSAAMLEQIGEIAAGQAMVHGMLGELAENDFSEAIDTVMRLHGDNPREARQALRGMAETLMGQLRDLSQLETQLLGNLAELQQSTAALRARPVATILRPLAAMAATESRRNRREARMTTAGGELALDVALLESLKHILRPLVMARLGQGLEAPQQMHLAVNRSDDQLSVMLEDDGGAAPPDAALTPVRDEIARAGGNLRLVRLPTGGLRVHIVVPMNLVVMEGMVVGVGGTRYVLPVEAIRSILQPDPAAVISVSVQGGQRWLRLGKEEIVMIQALPTATGQGPGAARRAPAMPGDTAPEAPRHGGIHVVVGRGGRSIAIPVDDLVGQQLVLLRPLRGVMSRLRNVSGVALLSGGEIGMVLSPSTLCGRPELDDRPAEALSA